MSSEPEELDSEGTKDLTVDRRLRFFLRRRSLSAKEKSESLAIGEGGVPVVVGVPMSGVLRKLCRSNKLLGWRRVIEGL